MAVYLPDLFNALPDDRAERWSRLAAFIAGWWSPPAPTDGVPEGEIAAAEARLHVTLPAALREAYGRFGQRDEIAASFDTLLSPRRLRRRDGMLVVWILDEAIEWGVRLGDLALADPPMVVREQLRDDGSWEDHPALPGEATVSRFFLWKSLDQATHGSRYVNSVDVEDVEAMAAFLAQRFALLDFGLVTYPAPPTRFYGGEDVVIALREESGIKVAAPNLAGYRRAMDAFRDLSLPWWKPADDDEGAYQGEFHEHKQGLADMDLLLRVSGIGGPPPAGSVPVPRPPPPSPAPSPVPAAEARPEDGETRAPDDLDPRLDLLVQNALSPYAALVPPSCLGYLRGALELVVDTAPQLQGHVQLLLGVPTPESRRGGEELNSDPSALLKVLEGLYEDLQATRRRRDARVLRRRGGASVSPSKEDAVDLAIIKKAESAMEGFVVNMPAETPPDSEPGAPEIARILRLSAASLFAGIVAALATTFDPEEFKKSPDTRYARVMLVGRRVTVRGQDERLLVTYYFREEDVDEVAERLGVSIAEAQEEHRAFLDHVASLVEKTAQTLSAEGRGGYAAQSPFRDLMALVRSKNEPGPAGR
jgi:hypothetical protein